MWATDPCLAVEADRGGPRGELDVARAVENFPCVQHPVPLAVVAGTDRLDTHVLARFISPDVEAVVVA